MCHASSEWLAAVLVSSFERSKLADDRYSTFSTLSQHYAVITTCRKSGFRACDRVEQTASRTCATACILSRSSQLSDWDTQRVRIDSKVNTSPATKSRSEFRRPTWHPSETTRLRRPMLALARLNVPTERTSKPTWRPIGPTLNRCSPVWKRRAFEQKTPLWEWPPLRKRDQRW